MQSFVVSLIEGTAQPVSGNAETTSFSSTSDLSGADDLNRSPAKVCILHKVTAICEESSNLVPIEWLHKTFSDPKSRLGIIL